MKQALIDIAQLLKAIELNCELDEKNDIVRTAIWLDDNTPIPLLIDVVNDAWVYISTVFLIDNKLKDDTALTRFYKSLLKENNYTKMGKFYINESDELEFSIDIPLENFNQSQLQIALTVIVYCISEKFPALVKPYRQLLFQAHQQDEIH